MIHTALVLVLSLVGALAVIRNSGYSLRLVGGPSRCQGRLQVQRTGQDWTEVDPRFVPLRIGHRVCSDLDCGSALSLEKKKVTEREAVYLRHHKCEDTSLINCFDSDTHRSDNSLQLNCSDSVRLVSGRSLCSGSLQIRDPSLDPSWTWVCEGALDRRGADVLCRELGCGAPLLQGALSPLGQTFHCEGHESALMDCNRTQTRTDPGTCSGPALNLTCSEPLRLVGGASRCEGTVEAELRGEWRPVMMPFDLWNLESAAAVCRDLDCGSAVSTETRRGLKRTDVWEVNSYCVKKSSVRECVYDGDSGRDVRLKVVCSDSVRLVSGRSLCSGSLQIRDQSLDPSWTWVCEGALDRRGADVLCRELGCGAPLLQGALSPLGQTFHCEGHESALMDCNRTQTRTDPGTCSGPALNLTCSEPLRLVGGASRCEGTVEAELRGEWRPVMMPFDLWNLESAAAVCRDLDCGSAVSTETRRGLKRTDVWEVNSYCVKKSSVRGCVYDGDSGRDDRLKVVCSDSVRLVSGRSLCSGSLQIRDQSLDPSWTWVCEGALDRRGADVLCRELGCGAPLLQGALSPLGQTFHCEGHESALMDCNRTQTRTDPGTCSGPALNLTCSEPLRLVGGASRCEGTVEAELRGEWRPVVVNFDPWNHWDLESAAAVCRDLDCGSAVSIETRRGLNITDVWEVRADCVKKSSVRGCVFDGVFGGVSGRDDRLKVVCSDSVRLVSGRSLCSGSLQIRDPSLDASWTWVCEGALDRRGADVLCRELGCGAPLLQGALSPLGQTFHCEGHESALMDCNRTQTRTDPGTCSGPALNLTCSEPLRLVGGASRCEGTVEAELRGEWRPVVMTFDLWDLESAAAVCRDLDCGSAVSIETRRGSNITDVWWVNSNCVKKSSVRECVYGGVSDRDVRLKVVCSELLNVPEVSVSEGVWAPRAEGSLWTWAQEGDGARPGGGGVWVLMGADFQVKCSIEPQYPGGSFQLLSPSLNLTLPAVNHSAHFLFTDAGHAHKGNYTCVYHLEVFNHNFTSNSTLHIYPGDSTFRFFIRALILLLLMPLNFIPYIFYRRQANRGRQSSPISSRWRYRAAPEEGADAVVEEI